MSYNYKFMWVLDLGYDMAEKLFTWCEAAITLSGTRTQHTAVHELLQFLYIFLDIVLVLNMHER
jgi:hypothetical protein